MPGSEPSLHGHLLVASLRMRASARSPAVETPSLTEVARDLSTNMQPCCFTGQKLKQVRLLPGPTAGGGGSTTSVAVMSVLSAEMFSDLAFRDACCEHYVSLRRTMHMPGKLLRTLASDAL